MNGKTNNTHSGQKGSKFVHTYSICKNDEEVCFIKQFGFSSNTNSLEGNPFKLRPSQNSLQVLILKFMNSYLFEALIPVVLVWQRTEVPSPQETSPSQPEITNSG